MQRSIRTAAWMVLGTWTCVLSAPLRAEPPDQPPLSNQQEQQQPPREQRQTPSRPDPRSAADRHASPDLDQLTDEELRALDERGALIFVKGERAASRPVAIGERAIGQRDLAVTPRRSADDLLRLVPGLYISQHASEGKAQQFFLRGFDAVHGSDVEVQVAGIPINELSHIHGHGYVDIGFVIPELVHSLTARKGSAALDQGNFATAGSVAFDLGVARELRGQRVRYEAGSTNRHRLLGVIAPVRGQEADFLAIEAMRDAGFGQNRSAERVSLMVQERLSLGRAGRDTRHVEFFGGLYGARFGEPGTLPTADMQRGAIGFYDSYSPDNDGLSYRAVAGGRFRGAGARHRLDAGVHLQWRRFDIEENFTGFLLYQDEGDRRRQQHDSLSAGLRAHLEYRLGDRLVAILGGRALADAIEQSDAQVLSDGTSWQDNRALDALQLIGAAHAGMRARLGRLLLEGGARADAAHFDAREQRTGATGQDTLVAISPRMSASYQLQRGRLFASYGRGLRSPEARSVVAPTTGDGMSPGQALPTDITVTDSFEIGTRLRVHDRISVGGTAFGIFIENEMVFDHATASNLARNATRRLGLELDIQARPVSWLLLRGDASVVDARFPDSGLPVPGAPRLLGTLEARVDHRSGLRGGAQFTYMAPRPLANGAVGGATHVLNLIGGYRIRRFDIDLQIDNAFGTRWRESEFHYASWFDRSQPRSELPRLHYTPGRPLGVRAALSTWF